MRAVRVGTFAVSMVLVIAATAMSLVSLESFEGVAGDPGLSLGTYQHPAGGPVLALSVGIGSAALPWPHRRRPLVHLGRALPAHGSPEIPHRGDGRRVDPQ